MTRETGRGPLRTTVLTTTLLLACGLLVPTAASALAREPGDGAAATAEPTATATATAEPTSTPTATAEPTTEPTPTPTVTASPTPSPTPTATPKPTPKPKPKPKLVKKKQVIGTTVQGRKITAYYRGWSNVKQKRSLVLLGQMHGDEKAGLTTARWVRDHVTPSKGSELWVIVTMNPDGNARGTRVNARGVDLNRNWATSGWSSQGRGTRTWGGPRGNSERETRAVLRFLKKQKPDYVASVHQPYGVIVRTRIDKAWEKRLSKGLGLPIRAVGVGTPLNKVSPTLTGWYNRFYRRYGTATTIEYKPTVSSAYAGRKAGRAITSAARVR